MNRIAIGVVMMPNDHSDGRHKHSLPVLTRDAIQRSQIDAGAAQRSRSRPQLLLVCGCLSLGAYAHAAEVTLYCETRLTRGPANADPSLRPYVIDFEAKTVNGTMASVSDTMIYWAPEPKPGDDVAFLHRIDRVGGTLEVMARNLRTGDRSTLYSGGRCLTSEQLLQQRKF